MLALVEAVVEVQAMQQVARLELTGKAERQAEQQGAERLEPKRQKVAEVREQEREPQAVQQAVAYQPQGAQAVLLGLCKLLH